MPFLKSNGPRGIFSVFHLNKELYLNVGGYLDRGRVARWLIEKLLSSYLISMMIIYGPMVGFSFQNRGLGATYTVVTSISILISILSNILIPQDFGVKRGYGKLVSYFRQNKDTEENLS